MISVVRVTAWWVSSAWMASIHRPGTGRPGWPVQFAVRKVIAQASPDGRPDPPLATPEGVCRW